MKGTHASAQEFAVPELLQEVGDEKCPEAEDEGEQSRVGVDVFERVVAGWSSWKVSDVGVSEGEVGAVEGVIRDARGERGKTGHVVECVGDPVTQAAAVGSDEGWVVSQQGVAFKNLAKSEKGEELVRTKSHMVNSK